MSSPCLQGDRVSKLEANYSHLTMDVSEIKSDVKQILSIINQLDSKYVRKEEFDELERCHTEVKSELTNAKGFISGLKLIFGILGLTSLAGLVSFAKVILKLF